MADVITTLHPEGAPEDNLYPNVRLENIKDQHGNARFVEGQSTITNLSSYATITYNKWSLSGTHLMIVVAGNWNASSPAIAGDVEAFKVSLPAYINDKITGGNFGVLEYKSFSMLESTWAQRKIDTYFNKSGGELVCHIIETGATNASATFRIQYDLLIDAD